MNSCTYIYNRIFYLLFVNYNSKIITTLDYLDKIYQLILRWLDHVRVQGFS